MPDLSPRGGGEAEARERIARIEVLTAAEAWALGDDPSLGVQERAKLSGLQMQRHGEALDAYRSAVRAAYREEVMAEMDRWIAAYPPDIDHLSRVAPAGEILRTMLPRVKASLARLTPRPTEDG